MPKITIDIESAEWAQALNPKYRYIFIKGGRSCVHGDTLIDTPKGKVKIKNFSGGQVYAYCSGKKIIAHAFPSEKMGKEHLYKAKFGNGKEIICTGNHKFLTNRGYVPLNSLSVLDRILSENAFAVLPRLYSSFRRLRKRHDRRQYDQQLLGVGSSFLAFSPSLDDVRQRNYYALSRSGDRESLRTYNPSCTLSRLARLIFLQWSLFTPVSLRDVSYYGHHEYYDIHVPIHNNYLSCGLVNHNSGKSHEVANYLCERSATEPDLGIVCLREVQKSIKRSSKQLIEQKLRSIGTSGLYKIIETEIKKTHPNDAGMFIFQGMNDLTADNVKSLEGFKIAWFEEAQNASFKTLKTLRPTIRAEQSQIIFTWNPFLPTDPIDEFCAAVQNEPDVLVIHVNYTENPFLSDSILREIELDKDQFPETFNHIWLGDYDTSFQGHYYARQINEAREQERITHVPVKDGVDLISAWDLGMRDSTAIWVAQKVGLQWRIVDYYENNFEPLSHYTDWMKKNGYKDAEIYLPHDGGHARLGMQGTIKAQVKSLGFDKVYVLKNNSVDARISLAKGLIKEAWFDKDRTKEGVSSLTHYHAKYDEVKKIYKPYHDWSSHGADAFGYLAQAIYKEDKITTNARPKPQIRQRRIVANGWMAS